MARYLLETWLSDVLAYCKAIGWDFVQFDGIVPIELAHPQFLAPARQCPITSSIFL